MNATVGIFITTAALLLGIVGVLQDTVAGLPPEFIVKPWVLSAFAIFGLLVTGLGWQEQLDEGKRTIIEKLTAFFSRPIRKLVWTAVLAIAQQFAGMPDLPGGVKTFLQILLAFASLVPLGVGYFQHQLRVAFRFGSYR